MLSPALNSNLLEAFKVVDEVVDEVVYEVVHDVQLGIKRKFPRSF